MHKQQFVLILDEPQVYGLDAQHLANLGGDEGLKLVHFKRGTEYFLKIVELSEPRNGFEQGVAFVFVEHRADQSRSHMLHQVNQDLKVRGVDRTFERGHFQRADQNVIHDDGNAGQGLQGSPCMEMGVVLARQFVAGKQERLLLLRQSSQRPGVGGHGRVIQMNLPGGGFSRPCCRMGWGIARVQHIHDSCASGDQFGGLLRQEHGTRNRLALSEHRTQ